MRDIGVRAAMRDEIDAISARRVRSSRFGSLSTWYRATAHTRCAHSFALSGSEGGGPSSSNRLTTRCVRRRGAVREDVFSESISLRAYVLARCESSRCGAGGPTRAATRARRAARCRRRRTAGRARKAAWRPSCRVSSSGSASMPKMCCSRGRSSETCCLWAFHSRGDPLQGRRPRASQRSIRTRRAARPTWATFGTAAVRSDTPWSEKDRKKCPPPARRIRRQAGHIHRLK